jgi:predicted dehydrogenase
MTPPSSHQKIAEAFIKRNIHVISDKPFAANLKQAKSLLKSINKNKKIVYALTHNYSAYPMVREAKKIVENEKLGKIEMINVEYVQDWGNGTLINHKNSKKILYWRAEKNIQGISSVLNEIGTHAYHLALYITGLKGKKIFADIKQVSKKVNCDDNAQVFINYENGAKGILWASTTAKGGIYGLRIRIFGTKGSIEWVQKDPNYLKFNPAKGAVKILEKDFNEAKYSSRFSRISYGHPEGFFDAFANIYSETATAILNKKNRKKNNKYLFPTAEEGYLTAKFVDTCKRSSSKKQWVEL